MKNRQIAEEAQTDKKEGVKEKELEGPSVTLLSQDPKPERDTGKSSLKWQV